MKTTANKTSRHTRRRLLLGALPLLLLPLGLAACNQAENDSNVFTMMTFHNGTHAKFEEALKEAYPEIEIEFVKYGGHNTTDYLQAAIKAGETPDIFVSTQLPPSNVQASGLINLATESFLSNLSVGMVKNLTYDGRVYMIPANYSFIGIYYNKTLFEEKGWKVPNSFNELETLIPTIEGAGVTLSECCTQYPGSGFAWLFDTAAGDFTTTLDGQRWIDGFLNGDETAKGNLEAATSILEKWIDCGMLNYGATPTSDSDTQARFLEGNTAFLMVNGGFRFSENEDGTGDQYGLLPFFSEDGSKNTIVTSVSSYYGLSKSLENNPKKLENAKKVLEFITTSKGMDSLKTSSNTISPLRNSGIEESSPVYDLTTLVDDGQSMSLMYIGWEDYVVDIGNMVFDFMETKANNSAEGIVNEFDTIKASGGVPALATVEETLTLEETAKVVGRAFGEAADADCGLISLQEFHNHNVKNVYGENGQLFKGEVIDVNTICTINPLGWYGTVKTMTMTGAKIKETMEKGYFYEGTDAPDSEPYPYTLVTKGGQELNDATTYKVACGYESAANAEAYSLQDTGLVGQDVLSNFFSAQKVVNKQTVSWPNA